jgi:hypothetical protein
VLVAALQGYFFCSSAAFGLCKILSKPQSEVEVAKSMIASHAQLMVILVQKRVGMWRAHNAGTALGRRLPPTKLSSPTQLLMLLRWQKTAQFRLLGMRQPPQDLQVECIPDAMDLFILLHCWSNELDVVANACLLVFEAIGEETIQRIIDKIEWLQAMWISVASSLGFDLERTLSSASELDEEIVPPQPFVLENETVVDISLPGDVHDVLPWMQGQLTSQVTLSLATCNFTPTLDNMEQGCIALLQGDVVRIVADDTEGTGWCCVHRLVREHHLYKEHSIETEDVLHDTDAAEEHSFGEKEGVEGWVPLSFLKPIIIPLR